MKYKYRPLNSANSIRLVELLPGKFSSRIRCNLIQRNLSDAPEFEALSYSWGDPADTRDILVVRATGRIRKLQLPVTVNLECALRRLRSLQKPRLLWIDAICINQADLREKSQQLSLMSQIYNCASQVVVWLGEAADDSDALLDSFAELDSTFYVDEYAKYISGHRRSKFDVQEAVQFTDKELPRALRDPHLKDALAPFYCRPWFRRVWVIQEVAFARSVLVICGCQSTTWEKIFSVAWAATRESLKPQLQEILLPEFANNSMRCVEVIQECRHNLKSPRDSQDMFSLTRDLQLCRASDPKDKIFALLSFDGDHELGYGFRVDYERSTDHLYVDVARSWLYSGTDSVLLNAGRSLQLNYQLPSWVPDWTYDKRWYSIAWQQLDHPQWLACGSTYVSYRISKLYDKDVLIVFGDVIDSIKLLGPASATLRSNLDRRPHREREEPSFKSSLALIDASDSYVTGELGKEAFARTITANFRNYQSSVLMETFDAWSKLNEPDVSEDDHRVSEPFSAGLWRSRAFRTRRFVVTSNGYMCLVPAMCEENDFICILHGCAIPFVLRKNGDFFELLGECYIHGFMNGEYYTKPSFSRGGNTYNMEQLNEGTLTEEDSKDSKANRTLEPTRDSLVVDKFTPLPDLPGWYIYLENGGGLYYEHFGFEISTSKDPRTTDTAALFLEGWASGLCWTFADMETSEGMKQPTKSFFVNLCTGETGFEHPNPDNALPPGWTHSVKGISDQAAGFQHNDLDIGTWLDPRICCKAGPVPDGWTSGLCKARKKTKDTGYKPFFVNLTTGETTLEDPGVPPSKNFPENDYLMII